MGEKGKGRGKKEDGKKETLKERECRGTVEGEKGKERGQKERKERKCGGKVERDIDREENGTEMKKIERKREYGG